MISTSVFSSVMQAPLEIEKITGTPSQAANPCTYPYPPPEATAQPLCILTSSVQSLSHVRLFVTPWTVACQASLSIIHSQSLLKLMSIESVTPSSHLILHCPLLLLPNPPSIRVFYNESTLRMRWPECWSFSFSISPSNEYSGLISMVRSSYYPNFTNEELELQKS